MVIVTTYQQRNKDSTICKRHFFKRGRLVRSDALPFDSNMLRELLKDDDAYIIPVQNRSDLDLRSFK